MKNITYIIAAIAIGLFLLTSCMDIFNITKGSGNIVKKQRLLKNFTKIDLNGSGNVFLFQGDSEKVIIETDDNILHHILTEVHGNELELSSHGMISPTKLNYYITVKDIKGLTLSGSGSISSNSNLKTDNLYLNINGSGDIRISYVECSQIKNFINGSGDIKVISGKTENMSCEIAGSGNIDLLGLESKNCSVNINGSGNCSVNVLNAINANINGSGNVYYRGNPPSSNLYSNGSGAFRKM